MTVPLNDPHPPQAQRPFRLRRQAKAEAERAELSSLR